MAEKIELQVNLKDNASKGLDPLIKKAAKLDGTDVEITVEAKVNKALDALDDVVTEAKKAEAAAEALSRAIGPELSQGANLDRVVADFRNMGLSLDEITDNADRLGGKLKEIGQTSTGGIESAFSRAKGGVDELGKSAGSSKSVLANMIGNSVQDLGTLGGVAGSAGVAIGQMGEYMADAAGSGDKLGTIITNFAGVAGPIAALSIGMGLITKVIGDIQKKNEEIAKNSKEIAEGIAEDFAKIETAADTGVQSMGTLAQDIETQFVKAQDTAGRTVLAVKELGDQFGGLGDILLALDQGGAGRLQWMENFLNNSDKVAGASAEISSAVAEAIVTGENFGDIYAKAFKIGGQEAATFVFNNKAVIESLEQVDDASEAISIDKIVANATDKLLNAKGGTDAWLQALAELPAGASKVEILNRALQIYTTNTEDAAQASRDAAKAQQALQDGLSQSTADWEAEQEAAAQAAQAVTDYVTAINSADWKAAGLEGATKGMQEFSDAQFGAADAIIDVESAIDDLGKTWKDNKIDFSKTKFAPDFSTEEGRKNQQALENLARAVDEQLGPAFADAGGDFNTFMKDAQRITDQALKPLKEEFNLSKTQVQELRKQLGLTTGDFVARFKLSGDEEAKVKLGLLQSAIEGLDKPTQMKIGAQIATGDVQGAVKTAQDAFNDPNNAVNINAGIQPPNAQQIAATVGAVFSYIASHPMPVIPVSLDDSLVHRQIKALQDFLHTQVLNRGVNLAGLDSGGTAGGLGGIAGERGPEILDGRYLVTQPTYIPPGTRVTSRKRTERILNVRGARGLKRYDSGGTVPGATTININAAVVGNRYDVMRAVSKANRDKQRLLGSRG